MRPKIKRIAAVLLVFVLFVAFVPVFDTKLRQFRAGDKRRDIALGAFGIPGKNR